MKTIYTFFISIIAFSFLWSCNANQEQTAMKQALQSIKDEMAIRALADQFSDAANRKDAQLFQSLWAKDAEWIIGSPINKTFKGQANMGSSVSRMLSLWDFFVQLSGPGVIQIKGDTARARFYVNEIARKADDQSGNYNLSMYDDLIVRENGKWVFLKRSYYTIYQEAPEYKGLIQPLPIVK